MKTPKFYFICLAAAIAIFTISYQISAQYTDSMGGSFNNAISASISTMTWNRIFYRTTGASRGAPPATTTSPPQSGPSQSAKPVNTNAVKFRPTGTYLKTKEFADSLGNTPAEREQYQKLMNAVLDAFGQQAQKAGFPNDIAAAISFFLGENIRIYRGMPDLSDQQYVDLRNSIADALVSTGAVNNLTDRQKQEMYEALVAYTGITQFGYEQGVQAKNDAIIKGYQKVAGQNLQTVTKISPDQMNIGPNGPTANGENFQPDQASGVSASNAVIDIGQLRSDYNENAVRANQIYKGKRFVFTGKVVEVSDTYYRSSQDETGRYVNTNLGTHLKVSNSGGGSVIGWNVYCFFKDNRQLAQLRAQQIVTFEATVQGKENGSEDLILVNAVLK